MRSEACRAENQAGADPASHVDHCQVMRPLGVGEDEMGQCSSLAVVDQVHGQTGTRGQHVCQGQVVPSEMEGLHHPAAIQVEQARHTDADAQERTRSLLLQGRDHGQQHIDRGLAAAARQGMGPWSA